MREFQNHLLINNKIRNLHLELITKLNNSKRHKNKPSLNTYQSISLNKNGSFRDNDLQTSIGQQMRKGVFLC